VATKPLPFSVSRRGTPIVLKEDESPIDHANQWTSRTGPADGNYLLWESGTRPEKSLTLDYNTLWVQ
jgi:hypothetical protein